MKKLNFGNVNDTAHNSPFSLRHKKLFLELSFLILIVGTNFILGDFLRENLLDMKWKSDDVYHITVINSFSKKNNFEIDFLPKSIFKGDNINTVFEKYPTISSEERGKGPIFYILAGSFYKLLDTKPENFYLHASIFNNIISSIFLILFFYLFKKKFDLKIAVFSTILVAFIPFFVWMSARIHLYNLLALFLVAALFFYEKKTTHYLIFGIFVGLAHLTHPFAIIFGLSYSIFVLLNKEFKGFLIFFLVWQAMIIPWAIRNYYFFKDIGYGLYLPFSNQISSALTFLPTKGELITDPPNFMPIGTVAQRISDSRFDALNIISGIYKELANFYHMDLLLLFIIAFVAFAFIMLNKQRNLRNTFLLIPAVITPFLIANFITNNYLISSLIFIIPLISIILLYKIPKSPIFEKPVPRLESFILIYAFISIMASYYQGLWLTRIPESKMLMTSLYLLIPLAVIGFNKITEHFIPNFKYKKQLLLLAIGLVILPITLQMVEGIDSIQEVTFATYDPQVNRELSKLMNVVEPSVVISSNLPETVFYTTGLKSIALPTYAIKQNDFEKFISFYNISYIAVYEDRDVETDFDKTLTEWPVANYYFDPIHNENSLKVFKITYIDDATINQPALYVNYAIKLEENGKIDRSKAIFAEIRNYQFSDSKLEEVCTALMNVNMFDDAIIKCTELVKKQPTNTIGLHNLAIIFFNTGQIEQVDTTLSNFNRLLEREPNNLEALKNWGNAVGYLASRDTHYASIPYELNNQAINFELQRDYKNAIESFRKLSFISSHSEVGFMGEVRSYTKLQQYQNAMESYQDVLNYHFNEIKTAQEEGLDESEIKPLKTKLVDSLERLEDFLVNEINKKSLSEDEDETFELYDIVVDRFKQDAEELGKFGLHEEQALREQSVVKLLKSKGELLVNLGKLNDAERAYLDIIAVDKFDVEAWKNYAKVAEMLDKPAEAIRAYEFVLKFESDNAEILDKINALKNKP